MGGGSKAGGLPTLPFRLSLPSPFPFPLSFQTNQWEGRSDPVRGKFPGFPPTNTTLMLSTFGVCPSYWTPLFGRQNTQITL